MEANEYLLAHKDDGRNANTPPSAGGSGTPEVPQKDGNKGTLTLDATCVPVNIRYPQDISLLNEAREKLEVIIYRFCKSYGLSLPRRYRRGGAPEKTILPMPKAGNTAQRRFGKRSVSSSVMLEGISGIWMSL